jgi:hypothetical protein
MTDNKYKEPMTQEQDDFIVFILSTNPEYPLAKLVKTTQEVFRDNPPTSRQIQYSRKRLATRIANTGTEELLRIATERGLLVLHKKAARLTLLERIAFECTNGYNYEIGDASGGTNVVKRREYRTAIDALKQIREEIGPEVMNDTTSYNIVISNLPQEAIKEEEELPGDDEL